MRRFLEEIVDFALSGALVVLLVGVAVLSLIQTRPVSISFLLPYAWPFIQPHMQGVALDYGDIAVQWPANAAAIHVQAKDLEMQHSVSRVAGTVANLELEVDPLRSIHERKAILTDLALDHTAVTLTLPPSLGQSGSSAGASPSGADLDRTLQKAGITIVDLLKAPFQRFELDHAQVSDLAVTLEDSARSRSLKIGPATAEWRAEKRGAQLSLQSVVGDGSIAVKAAPSDDDRDGGVALATDFDGLVLGPIADFLGLAVAAKLEAPVSGQAKATINDKGAISPVAFQAQTPRTTVELPGIFEDRLAVDALSAEGSIELQDIHLKLDRARIVTGPAQLDVVLDAYLGKESRRLNLELHGKELDHQTLTDFWPIEIVPEVRDWLKANLQAGRASTANLSVAWKEKPPEVPDDVKLAVDFAVVGAKINYMDGYLPVEDANGSGKIDENGMRIDLRSGRYGAMTLRPGQLHMTFMPRGKDDTLELQATAEGEVPEALRIVEALPIMDGAVLPIRPAQTKGTGVYKLHLALPLADDLKLKDVTLNVEAQAQNVFIDEIQPGLDLARGQLQILVDKEHLEVSGKGDVDGVPATIERVWASIDPASKQPVEATVSLAIDQGVLDRYAIAPTTLSMQGVLPTRVNVSVPPSGQPDIHVDVDLAPAALSVPFLAVKKARNVPGRATFGLRRDSLETHIDRLELITPDLEFEGDVVVTMDEQLKAITARNAVYGLTRLSGHIENDARRGYVGTISASTIDLRPFLEGEAAPSSNALKGKKTQTPVPQGMMAKLASIPPLDISLSARELIIQGGTAHDLKLKLQRRPGAWQLIDVSLMLPSGSTASGHLDGRAGGSPFTFETHDAGSILTVLDRNATYATGGRLKVKGTLIGEAPFRMECQVELHDFVIERAPVLAKLLTLASFTGILNTLSGNGIFFDRGRVHLNVEGDRIRLSDGLVHGSELGMTFQGRANPTANTLSVDGTVIPAYTINRAIGQIPLFGTLMRGRHGVGAFAVTFWADGALDDPSVGVNPLSLIVPGALRDWMREISRPNRKP